MKSTFSVLTPSFETNNLSYSIHDHLLRHWGYSNYLKSNQLHWSRGNWCSIEQYRSRKTFGFQYFTNKWIFRLSSLKGTEMTTWATVIRGLHSWVLKDVIAFLQLWRKSQLWVFVMNMWSGAPIWVEKLKIKAHVNMPWMKTGRVVQSRLKLKFKASGWRKDDWFVTMASC